MKYLVFAMMIAMAAGCGSDKDGGKAGGKVSTADVPAIAKSVLDAYRGGDFAALAKLVAPSMSKQPDLAQAIEKGYRPGHKAAIDAWDGKVIGATVCAWR